MRTLVEGAQDIQRQADHSLGACPPRQSLTRSREDAGAEEVLQKVPVRHHGRPHHLGLPHVAHWMQAFSSLPRERAIGNEQLKRPGGPAARPVRPVPY